MALADWMISGMTFSISEAAYEGFRLTRRKPLAVLAWAGLITALYAGFMLVAGPWIVVMMEQALALEGVAQPTPEQVAPAAQASAMIMLYSIPLAILGGAVLSSALVRAVLTPEDSRFAYMRLGRDELRVLVVKLMMAVSLFLASMVSFTLVGVLVGLATAVPLLWLVAFVGALAAVGLMVWLSLRLSLAVPATLAEGRIGLQTSFRLTKGKVLPLLGMALLAVLMSLLVSLLLSMALTPLSLLIPAIETADPVERMKSIMAQGPIGLIVPSILNGLMITAQFSLIYAPFAAAYQRLSSPN